MRRRGGHSVSHRGAALGALGCVVKRKPLSLVNAPLHTRAHTQLWEKRSGKCLATLREHSGPVYSAVWCTDGSMVASGGASRRRGAVWSECRGRALRELPRCAGRGGARGRRPLILACYVTFSPRHHLRLRFRLRTCCAGGDSCIFVYDVERVMAVAARVAAGEWVPVVDEEERVLVRIGASPDHIGEHEQGLRRGRGGVGGGGHAVSTSSGGGGWERQAETRMGVRICEEAASELTGVGATASHQIRLPTYAHPRVQTDTAAPSAACSSSSRTTRCCPRRTTARRVEAEYCVASLLGVSARGGACEDSVELRYRRRRPRALCAIAIHVSFGPVTVCR